MKYRTTSHFIKRVRQRIKGISPFYLAKAVTWAISEGRDDLVIYSRRIKYKLPEGEKWIRAFKFKVPDGRIFEIILDDENPKFLRFITVYHLEGEVIITGKKSSYRKK